MNSISEEDLSASIAGNIAGGASVNSQMNLIVNQSTSAISGMSDSGYSSYSNKRQLKQRSSDPDIVAYNNAKTITNTLGNLVRREVNEDSFRERPDSFDSGIKKAVVGSDNSHLYNVIGNSVRMELSDLHRAAQERSDMMNSGIMMGGSNNSSNYGFAPTDIVLAGGMILSPRQIKMNQDRQRQVNDNLHAGVGNSNSNSNSGRIVNVSNQSTPQLQPSLQPGTINKLNTLNPQTYNLNHSRSVSGNILANTVYGSFGRLRQGQQIIPASQQQQQQYLPPKKDMTMSMDTLNTSGRENQHTNQYTYTSQNNSSSSSSSQPTSSQFRSLSHQPISQAMHGTQFPLATLSPQQQNTLFMERNDKSFHNTATRVGGSKERHYLTGGVFHKVGGNKGSKSPSPSKSKSRGNSKENNNNSNNSNNSNNDPDLKLKLLTNLNKASALQKAHYLKQIEITKNLRTEEALMNFGDEEQQNSPQTHHGGYPMNQGVSWLVLCL